MVIPHTPRRILVELVDHCASNSDKYLDMLQEDFEELLKPSAFDVIRVKEIPLGEIVVTRPVQIEMPAKALEETKLLTAGDAETAEVELGGEG